MMLQRPVTVGVACRAGSPDVGRPGNAMTQAAARRPTGPVAMEGCRADLLQPPAPCAVQRRNYCIQKCGSRHIMAERIWRANSDTVTTDSIERTDGPEPAAGTSWAVLRRLAAAWLRDRHQFFEPRLPRTCPICGHTGLMIGVGHPPRWDSRCARCGSRERHRLLWLWITEGDGNRLDGQRILHFAPEKALRE